MSDNADVACSLCSRPVTTPVEEGDRLFCSAGCRDVAGTLGEVTDPPAAANSEATLSESAAEASAVDSDPGTDAATERAFFHVTGMHAATCEAFLTERAQSQEGVRNAEASYVTETIRVEYDPTVLSKADIEDALMTAGYRVLAREETTGESVATELARETSPETRALEDMLGYQYIAGVLFGTFMLFPYVVVFYPAQLWELLGRGEFFQGGAVDSGMVLLLPLFVGMTGVVVFFTGLPLLRGAYVSLRMGRPNTDLLASITILTAYVYSIVALLRGRLDMYFDLTIVVAAGVVAAIFYESVVKQRAMDALTDLTISQTEEARLRGPEGPTMVDVDELEPGDSVLVKQGERIPVDGVLVEGTCTVDESIVTGESLPVTKEAGDELVGGAVVTDDAAVVRVGDPPTSSIDRLTTAVWLLQSATHGLQRRTDRLAAKIVPALAVTALLAGAGVLALGYGPVSAILAVLTVILVACPWGLALSTPLSVATNLRAAMERGVVVFDETVFERFRETDVVVFDKTGTLTTGEMSLVDTDAPEDVLAAVGELERHAAHPAADAIASAFAPTGDDTARADGGTQEAAGGEGGPVTDFENYGLGVQGDVEGTSHLVGHPDLFEQQGWTISDDIERDVREARGFGQLPLVVGREGRAAGVVVLGDEPREEWDTVVTRLADRDVDVVVLTGDDAAAAAFFRDHPQVEHTFTNIPPSGKTAAIRRLQADSTVTMVGDGTNDAPALAQADLGIALGSGTALASDAADVAIADDDLSAVETTFELAEAASKRVTQTAGLALSYNALLIPAVVAGLTSPLVAMSAVIISGSLVVANAHRPLLAE